MSADDDDACIVAGARDGCDDVGSPPKFIAPGIKVYGERKRRKCLIQVRSQGVAGSGSRGVRPEILDILDVSLED